MFSLFKVFKCKPRIIPFNAYSKPETISKDEREILEKFHGLSEENKLNALCVIRIAYAAQENHKLDFIWDHLP